MVMEIPTQLRFWEALESAGGGHDLYPKLYSKDLGPLQHFFDTIDPNMRLLPSMPKSPHYPIVVSIFFSIIPS